MRSLLVLAAFAAGCATTSPPVQVFAKDGAPALLIECRKSIAECHAGARQSCPAGAYVPLEDNRRLSSATVAGTTAHTQHRFELTFRCQPK